MISKVELSQIEWITNGERASALNMNRPLKQFMTKYNINVETINQALEGLGSFEGPQPSTKKVVNRSIQVISENDSGSYNIGTSEITVAGNLPVGFNFYVAVDPTVSTVVIISLTEETIISTSESSYRLESGVAKFVKIDDTRWVATIEQPV